MKKRKSSKKKAFFFTSALSAVLLTGTIGYMWSVGSGASAKLANESSEQGEVVYPTLYSDTHITESAKVADPRFENIAIVDREDLVASVSLSIQTNKPGPESRESEKGTWLWTPIFNITPEYRDYILSGTVKNGIKNIYLSIDSYLDIYVLSDGPKKEAKKKAFGTILEDFIREANKRGVTVDAEAGWRNWAEEGHVYKAFAVLEYAIEFNKTHEHKLRGFQYDVEPYLLDHYQNEKKEVLRNFIRLINATVTKLDGTDLEFSVVVPEFYDGTAEATPRFFYAWKYGYAIDHLLRVLERRPDSKIIVMSYRNFSEGKDSSIEISLDEIRKANKRKARIVIAQETGDFPPPYITFHNTSRARYEKETATIEKVLGKEKSYAGLATHYINTLLELK